MESSSKYFVPKILCYKANEAIVIVTCRESAPGTTNGIDKSYDDHNEEEGEYDDEDEQEEGK